jgi:DNA-binding NarL/FixJ family response regulator
VTGSGSVLLVEDHELLAETLRAALRVEGFDAATVCPSSVEEVLTAASVGPSDLVLLDLDLGAAVGDGTALVEPLVAAGCAVLVVTGSVDRNRLACAVEAGAVGFVLKSGPLEDLLSAVRAVLSGHPVLGEGERFELLSHRRRHQVEQEARLGPFARLSPREQEVLRALAEGHSVEAIADAWVVAPSTVRTQVRAIRTKLGVGTQLAAVALARQSRWLDGATVGPR